MHNALPLPSGGPSFDSPNAELSLTGVRCGLQTRRGREAQRFNSSWSAVSCFCVDPFNLHGNGKFA